MASIETKDLLVEIGTEELPPKDLQSLAKGFGKNVRAKLGGAFEPLVTGQNEQIYWSPRRLAVFIPHVQVRQPDREMETFGPPVNIAFGSDGKPTPAAEGFARKYGTTVTKLKQKNGKLYFKSKVKGRTAEELVLEAVNEAVMKLPIPRRMRWGVGEAEFIRPVHWVVMMLGDKTIKGTILGIRTGNRTYGHRFLHPGAIVLKRPADYCRALRQTGKVWVEDEKETLKNRIDKFVKEAARRVRGKAQLDEALLDEVASMVEWPVAITGSFDKRFLILPDEVIVAVLESQQRYFPLRDDKGKLMPKFIAISNIRSKRPAEIRHGNERVIVPRLSDAMFFWENDRKTRLEARLPELERVVFQKELGSYGDKSKRVAKLAAEIARQIGGNPRWAERAALLAKCDLVTGMVGEFPELQGIMGGYYARHNGEPQEVARAIAEQYRPRFAGDDLPASKTGQALAIADKLDTVTGIFAIGRKPTGDKDPFALRRQALGALRIAIECGLDLDFVELLGTAVRQIKSQPTDSDLYAIFGFFQERLGAYYEDRGIRMDVFDAVAVKDYGNPLDLDRRLIALQRFLGLPQAKNLVAANKRIGNILKQAGLTIAEAGKPDPERFEGSDERALYDVIIRLEKSVIPQLEKRDYTQVLKTLATLRQPVDNFFDKVMVMAEDPSVRQNRLALLARLRSLFVHVADISHLQLD